MFDDVGFLEGDYAGGLSGLDRDWRRWLFAEAAPLQLRAGRPSAPSAILGWLNTPLLLRAMGHFISPIRSWAFSYSRL
ncbi:hypothetical protein [Thiorhodovibrio litoralis]|uniref:hypothetical protein n=1 Tax=Thiorhodovibrio litoralis TaxID=2952932 RepID=UPI002B25B887|nr:hypothetical protein [Thiorhodovibrio litoralis]WPL11910.1 hypothetical protein Thiosp_01663 [Thiorhodovibrio litoralis]